MPSKYRKKQQQFKKWYETNAETTKSRAQQTYNENSGAVKIRTAARKLTDKTGKQQNIAATQKLLNNNSKLKEKNLLRAKINTKRRLTEDAQYRQNNLARAKVNTKRRLTEDAEYRQNNLARAKVNTKRRLTEDAQFRQKHLARAKISTVKRLLENSEYRRKNLERAKEGTAKRLKENEDYRNKNRLRAKIETRKRWQQDKEYRDMQRKRVREEKRKRYTYKRNIRSKNNVDKQKLTPQQQYWLKRKAFVTNARKQDKLHLQQKRMQSASTVHLIDIKLLFNKAEHAIKCSLAKIHKLHSSLSDKVNMLLKKMPLESESNDDQNDAILTAIFGSNRVHTSTSEPYFWEQAYHLAPPELTIPVDLFGKAHIFEMVQFKKKTDASQTPNDNHDSTRQWRCKREMCKIDNSVVDDTIHLMNKIATTTVMRCFDFYREINNCNNPARTSNQGHSMYCNSECDCASLLRPIRMLSCHIPALRTITRRIYESRRIAFDVHAVRTAMNSGNYEELNETIIALKKHLKPDSFPRENTNDESVDCSPSLTEDEVMAKFGKALRTVVSIRDTYITTSCDVCEQLRNDLQSLKSYENRKGFDSEKMKDIIERLYINKTRFEDVHQFIESTMICRYCADKLRGNKDVARSTFNKLAVIETPECIKQLNLYERSLIKQCVTSIAVVRLGQVSNKNRPQTELNSALKGRIAYLPVDVTSNASFLPDQLLNPNSLVVLVGGQPTSKQKVWVSAVDLSKVHTALAWLRTHNALYKDVPAYTIDELKSKINDKVTGITEEQDDCVLIRKLDEAAKSNLYENFTVQPLSADFPVDALIDYQFNKVSGLSTNIFDSELDLKTYPELFPTGENGMRDALRKVKIGTSDYIKSRLLNKHSKFRLNINYLFHCFQVQEVSNMCHSVGHMLRSVTGKNMTAKEFHDRLVMKDGEVQSKMFSLLANLRGTKEFFAKLGMDVRWMIKHLGPPTIFLTCSTAEWFSAALINHLRTINSDVANIDTMTPAELCSMDPVTVTNHFYKKWEAIFSQLINAKETPLFGTVEDFFWRIEYQARGAPHVHCVLWIKDAPILGINTAEEVIQFINKICTCAKPDRATSPTLSRLVTHFQEHKCNKYCQKTFKRNGKFCRKCRFGFPRSIEVSTQLHDIIDCLAVDQKKQPRKRLYHLKRRLNEQYINDYNPALLLANEANVDVQFIGHVGSRLPYYITEYMTKHEKAEQDDMWQDIFTSSKSLGTNAMSFMLKSVKSRQVGANEAADRLLGHKLYSKSRQMRFVDLQTADKVQRVLKPAAEIKSLLEINPESENIYFLHWVVDIYPARPDEMENMSLHEVVGWYERAKVVSKKEPLQLKDLNICLKRRRSKPYIVTHKIVNPQQSDENKELYFYYLLKLFKPWRRESDLLLPGISYGEMFQLESDKLVDMVSYHNKTVNITLQDKQMESAVRERAEALQQREDAEVTVEDGETALQGCAEDQAMNAMQEVLQTCKNARLQDSINNEELVNKYQTLNVDQKRIVDRVMSAIGNDKAIYLLVSGQGGTGKSRVINILHRMINRNTSANCLSVVVSAPTGLAAFNVGGTTIHRLLLLPVEHGKPANYSRLGQDQLTTIRQTLKGLQLLIIDEVSMVSSLTLLYIHLRLSEITNRSELFGGISMVLFADFLQLPPVKGNQPFLPVTFLEAKQRIGSVASADIWQEFEYDELTINMRQSGDQIYAKMLSNIRIGIISDEEHKMLSERLIAPGRRASIKETCDRYKLLVENSKHPIILMPLSAQCNEINCFMLKQIENEIIKIRSIDTMDTVVSKQMLAKVTAAFKKIEEDTTRTAGLESCLDLCIGARVMLRRNKNVESGLVNGCTGTIDGFGKHTTKDNVEQISNISVKFDHINKPVRIDRESCSFEVLKNIYFTRKQFPIMLAFSITIHKAQGLSLETAIVDAGLGCFGSGMVYVALSRVTSQTGLHLIDFDRKRIVCDKKAITEYNRLRKTYTPHLGDLCSENSVTEIKQSKALSKPKKPVKQCRTTKKQTSITVQKLCKPTVKRCPTAKQSSNMPKCTGKRPIVSKNLTAKSTVKRRRMQSKMFSEDYNSESNNIEENVERESNEIPEEPIQSQFDNFFNFCQVSTADNEILRETCSKLNIEYCPKKNTDRHRQHYSLSAHALRVQIEKISGKETICSVLPVSGDGNCLYRALSLAVTGTQEQHLLIRSYIVNHMLHEDVRESMHGRFTTMNGINSDFYNYLLKMEKPGTWGTELEIISAAHLLNCSIICLCRYNADGQFCLQHFPPHFVTSPTCSVHCKHNSLYLVNLSGAHYETAVVKEQQGDVLDTEE